MRRRKTEDDKLSMAAVHCKIAAIKKAANRYSSYKLQMIEQMKIVNDELWAGEFIYPKDLDYLNQVCDRIEDHDALFLYNTVMMIAPRDMMSLSKVGREIFFIATLQLGILIKDLLNLTLLYVLYENQTKSPGCEILFYMMLAVNLLMTAALRYMNYLTQDGAKLPLAALQDFIQKPNVADTLIAVKEVIVTPVQAVVTIPLGALSFAKAQGIFAITKAKDLLEHIPAPQVDQRPS